ncbi:electron transport complex protein RnfG [Fusobacterium naviforme]|uniref:Ion-translocating oxidoreductase complex subunit G n=1 Tax=Moryella indoligenes TaxID=371674 RepID=A0AAE3V912_9FIRM|nr:RnfABCDGE type electron transport complex subunit G [Moryella indoligenes]KAB0578819.1 RnfABCDGE type electron transport complex subunit G [Fusobacterium naviforme]MDQ0151924.1 electron transport complex protein RnfG [Moryella indoligenes]PSL11593.1 electron transport complex protein RnfG [Fusobacterium naviforme]STO26675.1 electron transport complex protein RnfG [Fusobacterium naviforme]
MSAKKETTFVQDAIRLMLITLIAGLLLGIVYSVTLEPIRAAQQAATVRAYKQVYPDAADFADNADSDALIAAAAEEVAAQGFGNVTVDKVVDAKDASGEVIGHIINATSKEGFGGAISISAGIQEDGTLNGIAFLSISESAGLGMNARDTDWYRQFENKQVEKFSVTKTGAKDDSEIDAISGATITSRAVTNAVNAALFFAANGMD